jgi:hypothetical protein
MKKGCFFRAIFFLILLIGIGYHLYTEYGRELLEDSKEDVIELAYENLLEDIDLIPSSDYADSLKIILAEMIERVHDERIDQTQEDIENKLSSIREYLDDSNIELEEYIQIKQIIEDYEGSAKIGN